MTGNKPRLLDLFCGAGGSASGYQRAGFYVVGVDHEPQPRYCGDEFYKADALEVLREMVEEGDGRFTLAGTGVGWTRQRFDAIHASPPCQAFTNARVIHGNEHADLLTPTRELLFDTDLPWVIENVPGAPMRPDLVLCGTQFPDLASENGQLLRHRWFEFSDPYIAPMLTLGCRHDRPSVSVFGHGGHIYHGVEDWRTVMGIDWMTRDELSQAIPPAYTELIGHQLMQHIQHRSVAVASGGVG